MSDDQPPPLPPGMQIAIAGDGGRLNKQVHVTAHQGDIHQAHPWQPRWEPSAPEAQALLDLMPRDRVPEISALPMARACPSPPTPTLSAAIRCSWPWLRRSMAARRWRLARGRPSSGWGNWQNERGGRVRPSLRSLGNLAGLYESMGDYAGARPLYERALAIREHTLGPGHPTTAMVRANLEALLAKRDEA